jgi:hypothetical protein
MSQQAVLGNRYALGQLMRLAQIEAFERVDSQSFTFYHHLDVVLRLLEEAGSAPAMLCRREGICFDVRQRCDKDRACILRGPDGPANQP